MNFNFISKKRKSSIMKIPSKIALLIFAVVIVKFCEWTAAKDTSKHGMAETWPWCQTSQHFQKSLLAEVPRTYVFHHVEPLYGVVPTFTLTNVFAISQSVLHTSY